MGTNIEIANSTHYICWPCLKILKIQNQNSYNQTTILTLKRFFQLSIPCCEIPSLIFSQCFWTRTLTTAIALFFFPPQRRQTVQLFKLLQFQTFIKLSSNFHQTFIKLSSNFHQFEGLKPTETGKKSSYALNLEKNELLFQKIFS